MQSLFPGFRAESFEFLSALAENNNKAWFDRHRETYDHHITGSFRSLLRALEPRLLKLDPDFETAGKTNGNFSRINRDIRFSKDKRPYKSNFYVYVYDRRRKRSETGRLYVGLSAECVTVGFSIYAGERRDSPSALQSVFRRRFVTHRALFDRLLAETVRRGRYETYWHRQEKGEWMLHAGLPRGERDWLTLQAWIVRKAFPADSRSLYSPRFAGRIERIFRELYPLLVFTSVVGPRWQTRLRERGTLAARIRAG
jgi:uncharacterized protein (TIGR02453 family)